MSRRHVRILVMAISLALMVMAITVWLPDLLSFNEPVLASASTVFWLVTGAGLLCLGGGVVVVSVGLRDGIAEVAILGASLIVLSLFSSVHGLLTPGVLYGSNGAAQAIGFLALPTSLLVAAGLVFHDSKGGRVVLEHYATWSAMSLAISVVVAGWFLAFPNMISAPTQWPPLVFWSILALTVGGYVMLASRQVRLGLIGRSKGPFLTAGGFVFLSLTMLGIAVTSSFSPGWWAIHFFEVSAILVVAIGLYLSSLRSRSITSLIRPIIYGDSIQALEVGLTPVVHEWSATLEAKDAYTRGHVARVAELAMHVGTRAKLRPTQIRNLGLGALMHDIGKIGIPKRILTKPGRLNPQERTIIERHAAIGDSIMRSSPVLAEAAAPVRWHHERFDGSGYPDGLTGYEIPIEARITSVCDAFDAMTTNRAYRAAMPKERAIAILVDGSGSQWCPDAVSLVLAEVAQHGSPDGDVLGPRTGQQQEPEHDVLDMAS